MQNISMLRLAETFAGTGAFSRAFEETGKVKVVYANDFCKNSKSIYDLNFDLELDYKNIHDVDDKDIPEHDILTGGFPCQPFSIAGKRQGFDDKRSNVFWKLLTSVDKKKPKCVILENVKNLVTHDNKNTFKTIIEELEKRGYTVSFKVLNTSKITGVPQHRERIYIVCMKNGKKFDFDFPEVPKKEIKDFLEDEVDDKYYYNEKTKIWDMLKENVTKNNTCYQFRRVYVRENKSNECPTLTANMGTGGHNVPIVKDDKGIRKLTPRECFNLQGFPRTYKFPQIADSHLYKLAGNAVSLSVVKLIADKVVRLL